MRGGLDTLLRVLCQGEDTGLAAGTGSSVQWTLLTAASLVPLAHMVDTTTTVDRIAGIVATATGVPELEPAMLQVAGYLALTGVPETALSLLVRTVDITDPPAAAAPVLRAVAETGWSADPAADLGARRLVAGGPTVRELADGLSEQLREQAVCCDARNGRMMWTTLVPEALEYPVPLIDAADLVGIPALGGLALPAALPTALPGAFPGGTTDPADLAELPGVGPVTDGALVEAETGRGIVDATVITAVTASARSLPAPPSASPLGLVDHVADLADLADTLVTAGACHEACTVAAAGLAAVGGNWVDTGVASGCAPGEAGADDDGPVRLLRARSAALSSLGNTAGADRCAEAAATAAEYRGRWRLAEACRVDAAARRA
ncbi:hypothetical protein [Corynebacterium variabile]|uniref:hypothetical protein n=1 Tax=Corynebacterium variabile TaxID=1727 RepID=UPI0028A0818F|nr:hypothetical protein [Corynebacterium variabile]